MNAQEWLMRLQGSRAAILGFGISNRPLAEVLLTYGATVTVRDKSPKEALGEIVPRLEARGVRFLCGADYLEDLDEEIIFRAPGIRPDVPQISHAVERGGNNVASALIGMGTYCTHGMERTHVEGLENTVGLMLAYTLDI